MKKILLALAVTFTAGTAMAQMPAEGEGKFALEGQIGATFGGGSNLFSAPQIKMRYFFQENMAVRIGVAVNSNSSSSDVWENPNNGGSMGTMSSSSTLVLTKPGFEYHFGQLERLSPYVGAEIGIGFGGSSSNYENVDASGAYRANYTMESSAPTFVFQSNIIAGVDYYVAQNLYLGAEFGVGWATTKSKEGETKVVDNGTETISKTAETRNGSYGNNAVGGIRLGWRF